MLAINLTKSLYCSDINKSINFSTPLFNQFSYSLWLTTVIFITLLKPTAERKWHNLNENKRTRTIQNVCLVTTQSISEGSLDTRTWKCSLPRAFSVYQDLWKPSIGEKLVAKREFNNPMDKHAVKVVKGYETVSHLPRKFSRIAWYFLIGSGEISVIGCRRCGGMEAPCQLAFDCSNKVQIKLLKGLLVSKTHV